MRSFIMAAAAIGLFASAAHAAHPCRGATGGVCICYGNSTVGLPGCGKKMARVSGSSAAPAASRAPGLKAPPPAAHYPPGTHFPTAKPDKPQ